MAMAFGSNSCVLLALTLFLAMEVAWGRRLDDDLVVTWGDGRGNISRDGQLLTLSLNKTGGSGFQSNKTFVYVRLDVQIKLVSGNSAGTVATFYLISEGPWDTHDEIDLEFLGNVTGQPYTLHTNVFCNGIGGKEQQFHLWFDPAADFHTYSIVWTSQHILILVDGVPIREFKNYGAKGLPFPTSQPMRVMGSLWNADDWATQGGRVKTDWTQEPFAVYYRNFTATAAPAGGGYASPAYDQEMDATAQKSLKWARDNCMVYDYCKDEKRLRPPNTSYPPECSLP